MPLETATFIDGLNTANPTAGDPKSEGDDHIRLIKSAIKATFPNINAAVTATPAVLNGAATSGLKLLSSGTPGNGTTAYQVTLPRAAQTLVVVVGGVGASAVASVNMTISTNGTNFSSTIAPLTVSVNPHTGMAFVFNAAASGSDTRYVFTSGAGGASFQGTVLTPTVGAVSSVRLSCAGGTFNGSGTVLIYGLE